VGRQGCARRDFRTQNAKIQFLKIPHLLERNSAPFEHWGTLGGQNLGKKVRSWGVPEDKKGHALQLNSFIKKVFRDSPGRIFLHFFGKKWHQICGQKVGKNPHLFPKKSAPWSPKSLWGPGCGIFPCFLKNPKFVFGHTLGEN